MYAEKFATAVKVAGKVLRESAGTVALPFGSEYSILLKNMNSVRALVHIEIDGTDVTDGAGLIVPANQSVDLERFIKNMNFEAGNRFKFIERTEKIENGSRGIKAEDGLIRIQFEYEQPLPRITSSWSGWNPPWNGSPTFYQDSLLRGGIVGSTYSASATFDGAGDGTTHLTSSNSSAALRSKGISKGVPQASSLSGDSVGYAAATGPSSYVNQVEEIGITVPGSVSNQKFTAGSYFATDGQKHVMVLKLAGRVAEQIVQKPITVQTKPKCSTCGTVNKANTKFCRECGTALTLL